MWNHLPRSLVAVTAFITLTVGAVPVVERTDTAPPIEFVGMPAEFVAAATWATDLFEEADLILPPLRFAFHGDSPEPCHGRPGLHHQVDGLNVIEVCTTTLSPPTKILILHEAAHAWIDLNLTSERKAAFKALRGWTYWRDYDAAPWGENGTEQAAEIMVWGLIDRPLEIVRIYQNSCDELLAGYLTLTGQAPLHGYRDAC